MNSHPYTSPNIEIILLDNEISLQMQSMPPGGPEEVLGFNKESFFENKIKYT